MLDLARGVRVKHSHFGEGVVLARRFGGRVRVRFDRLPGLPRTVARDDVRVLEGRRARAQEAEVEVELPQPGAETTIDEGGPSESTSTADELRTTPISEPDDPETVADLRQTIEAMRLGVVPARFVREFTVARDRELAHLDAMFEDGRGFCAIFGDFGDGKTHLLEVAERLALERGFATARIILDPGEVPPTHPKRLYAALVEALRLPQGGGHGLEPLLHRLVDSRDHREPDGEHASRFFSPYLHALHVGDEDALGWIRDYARGDPMDSSELEAALRRIDWRGPRPLALSDYRTYGRMYIHMLGVIASWARDAGFSGLALLFDEVERVDALARAELGYALEVIRHFAAVTLEEKKLAFDPDALYRGGQPVHRQIPMRYREEQPLCVAVALTPLEEIRGLYRTVVTDPDHEVWIRGLDEGDLGHLVAKVSTLYRRAYPQASFRRRTERVILDRLRDEMEPGVDAIRAAVRGSVFLLDEARFSEGDDL